MSEPNVRDIYPGAFELRGRELFVVQGRAEQLREQGFRVTTPVQDGEDWVCEAEPKRPIVPNHPID